MDKQKKPRLAEVLGVEVGQKWKVICPEEGINSVEVWLNEKGYLVGVTDIVGWFVLCAAINHPESIIRVPRLTEAELAICKAVGAKWVSRGAFGAKNVVLWDAEPEHFDDDTFGSTDTAHRLARMYAGFENILPGDCICVEEVENNA